MKRSLGKTPKVSLQLLMLFPGIFHLEDPSEAIKTRFKANKDLRQFQQSPGDFKSVVIDFKVPYDYARKVLGYLRSVSAQF